MPGFRGGGPSRHTDLQGWDPWRASQLFQWSAGRIFLTTLTALRPQPFLPVLPSDNLHKKRGFQAALKFRVKVHGAGVEKPEFQP